jgi:hypothetical protein
MQAIRTIYRLWQTISTLEDTVMVMVQELSKSKSHHSAVKKSEKERMKDHSKESKFHLFKKCEN